MTNAIIAKAVELATRFTGNLGAQYDEVSPQGGMAALHDIMAQGATAEDLAQTGGFIYVSYTLHEVGGRILLASAAEDSIGVYLVPRRITHLASAVELMTSLCGEDEAMQILWADYDHEEPQFNDGAKILQHDEAVSDRDTYKSLLDTATEIIAAHERAIALLRGALAGLVEHCADWTDAPEHLVAAGCAALDATAG
jgi:hypothetical protein